MKPNWVATIEGENELEIKVGIQEREDGRFEVVGKPKGGEIESAEQIDDTYDLALDSIGIMYRGDAWKLQWIDKYKTQKKYIAKLKQVPLKIPVETYESYRDACERNGTKPVTELRKFIDEYIKVAP